MGETAGWSSATAATSSLAEGADGRLSYLLRSYDVSVSDLQIGRLTPFLRFFWPY